VIRPYCSPLRIIITFAEGKKGKATDPIIPITGKKLPKIVFDLRD